MHAQLMSPRILALVPTLVDDPSFAVESLRKQTTRVDRVIVACGSKELADSIQSDGFVNALYVKPRMQGWGEGIAEALNACLATVNLGDFDYIVRLDADTQIPANFISDSMGLNADLVGEAGFAMLIRMEPFVEVAGGRFECVLAEDTYLAFKLKAFGKRVVPWVVLPELSRVSGSNKPWQFFIRRGAEMYRLGFEPFHVVGNIGIQPSNVLAVVGYIAAAATQTRRYDFARRIFLLQLTSLREDVRFAVRGKKFIHPRASQDKNSG
jgi:glycosyltransferase involved in cell wall biosynthesis